jgi:ABC-type glycerol-3-phosphate transport system substrate-binding protein
MIRRSLGGFLAVLVIAIGAASCGGGAANGEETVEMVSGSYRTVGEGRAEILVGAIGDLSLEDQGVTVDAVEVEVTCGEQQKTVWASKNRLTEPVCRVQVELVEIVTWSPPKVQLKIVWNEQ